MRSDRDLGFDLRPLQILLRLQHAVVQRLRVAVIGRANLGRQNHLAVQVNDVLRLVRRVRPAVFQLRDPGLFVRRRAPLVVGDLFVFAALVEAANLLVRRLVLRVDRPFL